MAFDAGMVSSAVYECRTAIGARIDKIYQPDKDTVILLLHGKDGMRRLMLSASANCPRFGFTETVRENPLNAPMFCMLLRKHLGSARLADVVQPGFERVVRFSFETRDEMGFPVTRLLVIEIMGKYSNLSLLDGDDRVLGVLRPVDFSTSQKRQLLPGMRYEMPPAQDKTSPLEETQEKFLASVCTCPGTLSAEKYLTSHYLGLSSLTAREIVFRAAGTTSARIEQCILRRLYDCFDEVIGRIKTASYEPTLLLNPDGKPLEYSWFPITQYGDGARTVPCASVRELFDRFFEERDRIARVHNRALDITRLLSNAGSRLEKKLEQQRRELAECDRMEEYRQNGDLITASIWQLKRGMTEVTLTDYTVDPPAQKCLTLDARLSPSQNAQAYYKRYQKAKSAQKMLSEQIRIGEEELVYLESVSDSLERAELESDFAEIRAELYESGYASRMKQYTQKKLPQSHPLEFRTSGGYRVLAGKNNKQNEYLSHKLAARDDYWFHVKNRPGAHVILFCEGEEPSAEDFTEAATIAATCCATTAEAKNTPVDYTRVRYLKKTPGGKPGMVIYHTYWTAYVTPSEELLKTLKQSGKDSKS